MVTDNADHVLMLMVLCPLCPLHPQFAQWMLSAGEARGCADLFH